MKARISTTINAQEKQMWKELQNISSLMYVASPLLKFEPLDDCQLPAKWHVGEEYHLNLSLFGIIPLGRHSIKITEINSEKKMIISNEHGHLTKKWNHRIKVEPKNSHSIYYTDEIEIEAGVLTFSIWLFAHIFYRHRQRRWKNYLADNKSLE